MEQVNLVSGPEQRERSLRDKIRRAIIASTVPLALLAVGCSQESSANAGAASGGSQIESQQINHEQEKADKKMLLECLVRVAGGEAGFDILDNGDYAVMAGGNFYRLNNKAKEKVLAVAKDNIPSSDLDLKFQKTEIKIQTGIVENAVRDFGQALSMDELTPELRDSVKAGAEIGHQLTNPEAKDFL